MNLTRVRQRRARSACCYSEARLLDFPFPMPSELRLAAVDLGSNSFRLEIGIVEHQEFIRTEYIKEAVRQGGGLDANRDLIPEAMQAGWNCLARFGERLAGFKRNQVRAVATQTLREARNRDVFLARATKVLGFPIDVVSGREEARLIYQGVANKLPASDEKRLVIDIGGRSTELALGHGLQARKMESYRVGSLVWSQRYFPDGLLSHKHFQKAQVAAAAVLEGATNVYQAANWAKAYGSAGTASAIGDILIQAGWPADKIDREGLDWLLDTLVEAQHIDSIKLPGLREDRRPILAGGLSVLRALFDLLHIDTLEIAQGGLRHGLICDMLGERDATSDLRDTTVERLASKFQVDAAHARRVGQVATALYRQLYPVPQNGQRAQWDRALRKLGWAAQLHEIGSHISHSDYHKHGAYILDNADALGFAVAEMQRLGVLVLGHRGKLRKIEAELDEESLRMQLVALRLAVILCHARRDPEMHDMVLRRDANGMLSLRYPAAWALKYPQSAYLLQEEAVAWQKTTWTLDCSEAHS